jgi:hypothetical protein
VWSAQTPAGENPTTQLRKIGRCLAEMFSRRMPSILDALFVCEENLNLSDLQLAKEMVVKIQIPVVGIMKEVALVVPKSCFTSSMTDLESFGKAGER